MARPKKEESEKLKSFPVKLDDEHQQAIEEASKKFKLPKSEIFRITSKAGLKALKRMSPEQLIDYIAGNIK